MVFPSPGCHMCRRRRVKCDSGRPICGQCQKGSRSCTWDTDDAGLVFRSENAFAQGRPRKPRKPREPRDAPGRAVVPAGTPLPPRIRPALSIPTERLARNFWVERFCFRLDELPDMAHEYGAFVAEHWNSAAPDSALGLALAAYSQLSFGHAKQANSALAVADKVYAKTVMKTQQEIQHASNEGLDRVLMATMLMAQFEYIMYNTDRRGSTASGTDEVGSRFWTHVCHHIGAAGLLKLLQQRGSPMDKPLYRAVRRQVLRTCILRGATIPVWVSDGAEFGEEGPPLALDRLMIRVATLRHRSLSHLRNHTEVSDLGLASAAMAAQAEVLESSLAEWSKTLPEEWGYVTGPAYNGIGNVHRYTSHGQATVWNRYRTLRLITNSIRMRTLTSLLRYSRQEQALLIQKHDASIATIAQLAKELGDSVPFFHTTRRVQDITDPGSIPGGDKEVLPKMAILLAWPLAVAVSTEGVPDIERRRLQGMLKVVAESLGDGLLNSTAQRREFRF